MLFLLTLYRAIYWGTSQPALEALICLSAFLLDQAINNAAEVLFWLEKQKSVKEMFNCFHFVLESELDFRKKPFLFQRKGQKIPLKENGLRKFIYLFETLLGSLAALIQLG